MSVILPIIVSASKSVLKKGVGRVGDESKKVITESKNLLENLSKVDMKQLKNEEAHNRWMTLEKELKAAANSMSYTSNIKAQRDQFKHF